MLHDAMKAALGVAHIQDLPVEEIQAQAWELEVAAATIDEPNL